MAVVNDLASVAAATSVGYILTQYIRDQGSGFAGNERVCILSKRMTGATGTSGHLLEATGVDPASATTARTNALSALNAKRRHRYAGSPGAASGATVVNFSDGLATVPTVDVT